PFPDPQTTASGCRPNPDFFAASLISNLSNVPSLHTGHCMEPSRIVPAPGSHFLDNPSTIAKVTCLVFVSTCILSPKASSLRLASHRCFTSGTFAPQAGLGHFNVRAHKYAKGTSSDPVLG